MCMILADIWQIIISYLRTIMELRYVEYLYGILYCNIALNVWEFSKPSLSDHLYLYC